MLGLVKNTVLILTSFCISEYVLAGFTYLKWQNYDDAVKLKLLKCSFFMQHVSLAAKAVDGYVKPQIKQVVPE